MTKEKMLGWLLFICFVAVIFAIVDSSIKYAASEKFMIERAVVTAQRSLKGDVVKGDDYLQMLSLLKGQSVYRNDLRNALKIAGVSDEDVTRLSESDFVRPQLR